MTNDGELEMDGEDQARVEEALLVETLMGWDDDRCECQACNCPRFRDGADATLCAACREGDHWRANG